MDKPGHLAGSKLRTLSRSPLGTAHQGVGQMPNLAIANLRYPAKNDKNFAGEHRYSNVDTKRLVRIEVSM